MAKNVKEIEIKVEGKEWEEALDKAFKEANKKAKIDGFRPGHAPKEVFIKKYGEQALYMDAAEAVVDGAYEKMLKENEKDLEDLVARPDVQVKEINGEGVTFNFVLTMRPEVKLGDYKKINVKREKAKVTAEEIEDTIENIRHRYAEDVLKDGEIKDGDVAVIDFEGFVDGVAFEGGKGENYSLKIGSGTFIPGFEEQLIGLKSGDEKDVEVTFPEDYHAEELKGKKATFKVKVHEVKEVKVPELDKDFFEDLGMEGVDTKEKLEAKISESILTNKESELENKYIDELLEAAAKDTEVDIPEVMIDDELERMIREYDSHLRSQGITLEQFYKFTNSDEEALKSQMRPEAARRVKHRLMLEEIAKQEKIEISDEEANKEAERLAENYQIKKEEFLQMFGGLDLVKYDLKMRKAIDVLKG
mgnify:FL=1